MNTRFFAYSQQENFCRFLKCCFCHLVTWPWRLLSECCAIMENDAIANAAAAAAKRSTTNASWAIWLRSREMSKTKFPNRIADYSCLSSRARIQSQTDLIPGWNAIKHHHVNYNGLLTRNVKNAKDKFAKWWKMKLRQGKRRKKMKKEKRKRNKKKTSAEINSMYQRDEMRNQSLSNTGKLMGRNFVATNKITHQASTAVAALWRERRRER